MRQVNFGVRTLRWVGVGALVALIPLFLRATGPVGARVQPPSSDVQAESAPRAADELTFAGASSTSFPARAAVSEAAEVFSRQNETGGEPDGGGAPADKGAPQSGGQDSFVIFTDGSAKAADSPAPQPTQTQAPDGVWAYENSRVSVHITRNVQGGFTYYAADIKLTDPSQFSYAFSHEKYGASEEALSDIAARHDPLVAINGDYYSFHNNGIILRGGKVFRKNKSSRHLLIVENNGDLRVMTDRSEKQGVVAARLENEGVLHTFEFGPVLVENGEAVKLNSAIVRVGDGYLEPRTAIGQLGPLHYLILVVDGRSQSSEGCDLPTLQRLFLEHGVSVAFNLDGGGSTTLWFDGRVINNPASGDERKVSDIVMFMR